MKPVDPLRAEILALAQSQAQPLGLTLVLIGALARDIWLEHIHGIETGRATRDVDLTVVVDSWEAFSQLKNVLVETGRFAPVAHTNHRLRFDTMIPIDIVPCGGVESEARMIAWPPDHEVIRNGIGLREACKIAVPLELAAGVVVHVVPVSGLAALKLLAWQDRQDDRDAHDLQLIASQYLNTGGRDRIYEEQPDLINDDFDYERTGAQLLGRDIRQSMGEEIAERLRRIIRAELDASASRRLIGGMARNSWGDDRLDTAAAMLRALDTGLGFR